ncbi:hypothetical protein H6503_00830 [Candidatus Woesearchaeota archaeon]|nr:hypothetical protein [Candidatus Woesearchaeota archaeon]
MVERLVLVDKQNMEYEGIFVVKDLYTMIDEFLEMHGYQRREIKDAEVVKKTGRNITMVFEPWKQLSDYAKSVFKVQMILENIRDLQIEKEGRKINVNQGKAKFIFDAYLENDFEHRWENKPGFFFVRILFDKYIFKPFTTDYQGHVMNDFKAFVNEIRAFLNLHKY